MIFIRLLKYTNFNYSTPFLLLKKNKQRDVVKYLFVLEWWKMFLIQNFCWAGFMFGWGTMQVKDAKYRVHETKAQKHND